MCVCVCMYVWVCGCGGVGVCVGGGVMCAFVYRTLSTGLGTDPPPAQ